MKTHDVYAYGVVSSSTLYSIHGSFPKPQGYAEIESVRYMTGGEATNSSIVLSRLGAQVKLDGNWLGAEENGKRTKALLASYQIETSRLPLKDGYKGVEEVVFTAGSTRTIFGTYGRLLKQADWNAPQEEDITQSKVVCLDPFFAEPASQAAEIAFKADIPVITVDCLYDNPLLRHTSAIVVAESFINENYVGYQLEDLFRNYLAATDGVVIFTFGDAPVWYARRGESRQICPAYAVDPIDTTGGGDAFRAGIAYGFLNGWQDAEKIKFAAAVAALICARSPGVMDAPTLKEVKEFMHRNKM